MRSGDKVTVYGRKAFEEIFTELKEKL